VVATIADKDMKYVANIVNGVLDARGWRGKVLEQMAGRDLSPR
jgi:hypothetical protein